MPTADDGLQLQSADNNVTTLLRDEARSELMKHNTAEMLMNDARLQHY